jgi:hypothetical protein
MTRVLGLALKGTEQHAVSERLDCDRPVSYGEMSRRSGVAAEEDNHSDISPL